MYRHRNTKSYQIHQHSVLIQHQTVFSINCNSISNLRISLKMCVTSQYSTDTAEVNWTDIANPIPNLFIKNEKQNDLRPHRESMQIGYLLKYLLGIQRWNSLCREWVFKMQLFIWCVFQMKRHFIQLKWTHTFECSLAHWKPYQIWPGCCCDSVWMWMWMWMLSCSIMFYLF